MHLCLNVRRTDEAGGYYVFFTVKGAPAGDTTIFSRDAFLEMNDLYEKILAIEVRTWFDSSSKCSSLTLHCYFSTDHIQKHNIHVPRPLFATFARLSSHMLHHDVP